jgi:MobA/MobL family
MAIYHFSVRIVSRGRGQSAVAVAARRSGEELYDRLRNLHVRPDRENRPTFAEILRPADAPAWMSNREELWNAAEATERRGNALVAREVEMALPLELEGGQAIALVRDYVQQEFIQRSMIADLTIRLGGHKPYANAMLALRTVTPTGFGGKVREWNQASVLREWREHWADRVAASLRRAGHPVWIDHRGRENHAAVHLGKATSAMQRGPRSKGEA